MCDLSTFVDHVLGCRVNDEQASSDPASDYLVWSRDVVEKVAKESLLFIYGFRPDLFASKRTVTLSRDACVHELCTDCCRVLDIYTVDGCDCNKVEEHKDENDDKTLDFLSCYYPDCDLPNVYKDCHPDCYDPGDWQFVGDSPCTIRFKHASPSDRDVRADISCVPKDFLEQEFPCTVCNDLFPAVVDNMLFRLYSIDHKDGVTPELADRHWRAFTTFMTTKFQVDFSLYENNYLQTRRRVDGV